ncbi:methyltransferase domain-containing protein [Actinomadura oligospora]|uniref:methyltransferase domain-containing protein n=1 Tax=Actinomadura oligospora TaxID=111804 RepID=UPI0004B23EC1|nr:methyltransferase domain-containing protein [Actinomadura oligospora]
MATEDDTKLRSIVIAEERRPPDTRTIGYYYDHGIFDVMAELWDGNLHYGLWRDENDDRSFDEAAVEMTAEMIRRLDPKPGDRVLDVGCGNGTPALQLARACEVEVLGISVSERQVARANERARAEGVADRVSFQVVNAMDLPFEAASFDGAWALESMLHMPDKVQVLSEVARVVRPGGRVPIADMVYKEPEDRTKDVGAQYSTVYASLTPIDDYAGVLERAGLVPENIRDVTVETFPTNAAFAAGLRSRRDQFVTILGTEGYELLIGNQEKIARMPELGYVLITARRP